MMILGDNLIGGARIGISERSAGVLMTIGDGSVAW